MTLLEELVAAYTHARRLAGVEPDKALLDRARCAIDSAATKVFTIAHMPQELAQAWLQHLRDFDVAHPGCHFEVGVDAPDASLADMVRALKIDPELTITEWWRRPERKKKGP